MYFTVPPQSPFGNCMLTGIFEFTGAQESRKLNFGTTSQAVKKRKKKKEVLDRQNVCVQNCSLFTESQVIKPHLTYLHFMFEEVYDKRKFDKKIF